MLNRLRERSGKAPRILLVGEYRNSLERCYLESWIGFERSLGLAWPGAKLKVLIAGAEGGDGIDENWFSRLWAELCDPAASSALFEDQERFTPRIKSIDVKTAEGRVT